MDATERLLQAVQELADTATAGNREAVDQAKKNIRRIYANEQFLLQLKTEIERLQTWADRAIDTEARLRVAEYKVDRALTGNEQLFAGWRTLAGRILILYIAIGIVLTMSLIVIGILLFR